jgi:hypothetical protein
MVFYDGGKRQSVENKKLVRISFMMTPGQLQLRNVFSCREERFDRLWVPKTSFLTKRTGARMLGKQRAEASRSGIKDIGCPLRMLKGPFDDLGAGNLRHGNRLVKSKDLLRSQAARP